MTPTEDPSMLFNDFLRQRGLNLTRQREEVLGAFLRAGRHVSAEDLVDMLRADRANVGQTTVYRTLKLLVECGLAEERRFGSQVTVFEPVEHHHEHLICTSCHQITEFAHEELERLKEAVAASYGFTLQRHTLNLYGLCPACQKKESDGVHQVV